MPTIQQLAATLHREVAETLQRNALAVPEDKVTWKPLDTGRSVLSQIGECAVITGFMAQVLTLRAVPPFDMDGYYARLNALDTLDKALAALKEGTDAYIAAIEAFPTEELDTLLAMPWSPEPQPFAQVLFAPYWNSAYHTGQIGYIQTLYGDTKNH